MGRDARQRRLRREIGQIHKLAGKLNESAVQLRGVQASQAGLGQDFRQVVDDMARQVRQALNFTDTATLIAATLLEHIESDTPIPAEERDALRIALADIGGAILIAREAVTAQEAISSLGGHP